MKTIGLIGGMSWQSSVEYYRVINETVQQRCGGSHNAKSIMVTIDFHELETMQRAGQWDEAAALLVGAARQLEASGADFGLICANTMHRVLPIVQQQVSLPFIHIASATADRIQSAGLRRVGLLGTRYTMEGDFISGVFRDQHGLDVIIPDEIERADIHRIIYDELTSGVINPVSRARYSAIMHSLEARGADSIALACTEISLLVRPEDSTVPQFDTMRIHAEAAVDRALA